MYVTCTHMHTPKINLFHPQTRDFINVELLKDFPIGKIDKCSGLCRPVSFETTHQWMMCCDCKYKPVQKTYYNDTHERHDNQLDRINKSCRHAFTACREEKWYCISPEEKKRLEGKYTVWPSDEFCSRIPKRNVGTNPPGVGTLYYRNAKQDVDSEEDWYEYHTDFLPEQLALSLNSGRGGFVSQQNFVILPCAAPRSNQECIERLCDLLTTSCPKTELVLQKEIDRIIVGSSIRFVCLFVFVCMHALTATTYSLPTGNDLIAVIITAQLQNAAWMDSQQIQNHVIL